MKSRNQREGFYSEYRREKHVRRKDPRTKGKHVRSKDPKRRVSNPAGRREYHFSKNMATAFNKMVEKPAGSFLDAFFPVIKEGKNRTNPA
jgi:hypothetical protein